MTCHIYLKHANIYIKVFPERSDFYSEQDLCHHEFLPIWNPKWAS